MPTIPHIDVQATDALRRDRVAHGRQPSTSAADATAHGGGQALRRRSSASACVGASTITRTSGSVPLGRTSTRPCVAELGLDRGDLVGDALGGVGHRRARPAR